MDSQRLSAVTSKEILEITKNPLLVFTVFLPPLLLAFLPLILLSAIGNQAGNSNVGPEMIDRLKSLSPQLAQMSPNDIMEVLALQQFLLIYLMMPIIIPMTVAAFSIIGEKEGRSLEPLLATPVTTGELLLGKSVAAVIPAILATWLAYAIFFVGASIVMPPNVYAALLNPMWIIAVIILAPLLCLLSVSLGVFISSRVNDTRVAQQIGGALVIPVIALGLAQTTGFILLNALSFAVGAGAIALLDVAVLYMASKLFRRETILTQWK